MIAAPMTQDNRPTGFDELELATAVLAAVKEIGYESPTPIQLAAIGPLLDGRDLLGQAQTGTGKTAAFALPLLSRLDLSLAYPQFLVLTPTRELAIQVAEALQAYARHLKGFHVLPVYGGQGMDVQLRQLRRGVHAVVGTPGRIQDHLRRGTLKLDRLRTVVIDEADEMLRMGFIDDVEEILQQMPEEKQVALFSATLPDRVRKIVRSHLSDPVEVKIKAKTVTVEAVSQRFVEVGAMDKLEALTRILEIEDFDAMLIFVRTRSATTELAEKLAARGLASAPLSGDMTQALRERTIERLKNGKLDIVVATDVAARGLDVERISHVVNYDIPHDVEGYIHRIGRTGRAGRKGHAILFVTPRERRMLAAIERATRQQIAAMRAPSRADVADRRVAQFKQSITDVIDAQDLAFFADLIAGYQQEHGKSPREIAAALAYLAQRGRPLLPPAEQREKTARPSPRPTSDAAEPSAKPPRRERSADQHERPPKGMVRYRLAVGREHGVQPGNIVGAIANEANIDSQHIGLIKIFDGYSTVDLPEGMPVETFNQLQNAWVAGQKLAIREAASSEPLAPRSDPERHAMQSAKRAKPAARKHRKGARERTHA
jgi:ATP-dependent RNA helicase DeaD